MKIARCPFFNDSFGLDVCNIPLGEATGTIKRRWICTKHGLVGGDKIVNWEYSTGDL